MDTYSNRMKDTLGDYAQFIFDFENASSLRSLRSPHAPFIFYFLYQQFKRRQRVIVAYQELVETLDSALDERNAVEPGSFPRAAKNYIDDWSKTLHLLRIYQGKQDEWQCALTADAERVLLWLEEMRQRPFVGTESRFRSIFATLDEIAANSNSDPQTRVAYLRAQQDQLQAEIDQIQRTGNVQRLNDTQLRERYLQANENALRLLSDFAAVEQSFRDLARQIQEAVLRPDLRKGAVLGDLLKADEALEASDEGKSFRAFWHFLGSPTQRDEFTRLLRVTQQLEELAEVRQRSILPGLTKRLQEAGGKIIESNKQLATQLRRMLDEQSIAESQRVRELCAQIKQLAFQHVSHPPVGSAFREFTTVEVLIPVQMLLDRPLWSRGEAAYVEPPEALVPEDRFDPDEWAELYAQFYVDEDELVERISHFLDERDTISLREILNTYPTSKGISEVLTYLKIAAEAPHILEPERTESISVAQYESGREVLVKIPYTVFRRMPRT